MAPEHPRGVRSPEGAGQGALPRRLHAHAEPGGRSRERRDRLGPLRRHDARLPPRDVADVRRTSWTKAEAARRRHRRDEDAEGRAPRRTCAASATTPASYAQAAFRWVLSNPDVSCLVVSFFEPQHVDEYLARLGHAADAPRTSRVLERYDALIARRLLPAALRRLPRLVSGAARRSTTCCATACTSSDYGREREGMRLYAALDRNASLCAGCPAPCAGTCPVGVPIRTAMMDAHRRLTL